jgi:hypothetical protein
MELPTIGGEWSGLDALTPILDRIRDEGGTFLMKLDGDRPAKPYTAVVSRSPVEGWMVRRDAGTLEEAVVFVLARYSEHRQAGQRRLS